MCIAVPISWCLFFCSRSTNNIISYRKQHLMPALEGSVQKVQKKIYIHCSTFKAKNILHEMIVCVVDIETTGLNEKLDLITAIGVIIYESDKREKQFEHCYNVCLARAEGSQSETELKNTIRNHLESCDKILAYNGVGFDNKFLAVWVAGESCVQTLQTWNGKTIDFFLEAEKLLNSKIGMQKVCDDNGLSISKIATGKQAVIWALEEKWDLLLEYCLADVQVLLRIFEVALQDGIKMIAHTSKTRKTPNSINLSLDNKLNVVCDTRKAVIQYEFLNRTQIEDVFLQRGAQNFYATGTESANLSDIFE